ncbi:MAG: DNA repair protein RecO [Candidatus Shapirobacteria bacterium]
MSQCFSFFGFVVGQSDLGEQDLLLSLLTKKRGKILVKAKGLRKITSKRLGVLQTGNLVKGQVHPKGDFFTLGEVELISSPIGLRKDLVGLGMVLTMSELINRLLPEREENQSVYHLYENTLRHLEKKVEVEEMLNFEIKLLDLLGYGLPEEIKRALKEKDLKLAQSCLWAYLTEISERKLVGLGKILA